MALALVASSPPVPELDSSRHPLVGRIEVRSRDKAECGWIDVYHGKELLIGRDASSCQLVFLDPTVSNRHLKIYSVIHDLTGDPEIAPLVYAEDLSSNGTYWENSFIGKGNGAALLSDGDRLRISPSVYLLFHGIKEYVQDEVEVDCVRADEISCFEASYRITKRKLGFGASGEVYLAIHVPSMRQVACKIVSQGSEHGKIMGPPIIKRSPWEKMSDVVNEPKGSAFGPGWHPPVKLPDRKEDDTHLSREVRILMYLNHPNVIQLEKVFNTDNSHYIFQELVTGGDLYSFIEYKGGYLKEIQTGVIVRQVLEALKYLHEEGIVHRDVKPDNILIASPAGAARVVLTDFGSATKLYNVSEHQQRRLLSSLGTAEYMAPEVKGQNKFVKAKGYTKAVDMWSLGCVTAALLTGASLFNRGKNFNSRVNTERVIEMAAAECDLTELDFAPEWQHAGELAKSLVKGLLVLDESQRLTAAQALDHEWFTNDEDKSRFDAVYRKAIKNWIPARRYKRTIEKIDLAKAASSSFLKPSTLENRKVKKKPKTIITPIDAHYLPPHKRVESLISFAQSCASSNALTKNELIQQAWGTPSKAIATCNAALSNKKVSKKPTIRSPLSDTEFIGSIEAASYKASETNTPTKITSEKEYIERLLQAMEFSTTPDLKALFDDSHPSGQLATQNKKRKRALKTNLTGRKLFPTIGKKTGTITGNETNEDLSSDLASSTLMEYDDCLSDELWYPSQDEDTESLLMPTKRNTHKRQKLEIIIPNRPVSLPKAVNSIYHSLRAGGEAASSIKKLKTSLLSEGTVQVPSSDPILGPVTTNSKARQAQLPAPKRPDPNTSKIRVSPLYQNSCQRSSPFQFTLKFRAINSLEDDIEDKENLVSAQDTPPTSNGRQPNIKKRRLTSGGRSLFDDAKDSEVYDRTAKERRSFRSALSFAKAVEKNKLEKGVGSKGMGESDGASGVRKLGRGLVEFC